MPRGKPQDIGFSNILLAITQKHRKQKQSIQVGLCKTKKICTAKKKLTKYKGNLLNGRDFFSFWQQLNNEFNFLMIKRLCILPISL